RPCGLELQSNTGDFSSSYASSEDAGNRCRHELTLCIVPHGLWREQPARLQLMSVKLINKRWLMRYALCHWPG
ncbi:MAG: hypothetical protein M1423_09195, partial [Acidobacteria bacterium]|nr:hypothetical protein [Acidobacteriota bacterium]